MAKADPAKAEPHIYYVYIADELIQECINTIQQFYELKHPDFPAFDS